MRGSRSPDKKERNHRSTGHTDRDRKNHTYPDTVTHRHAPDQVSLSVHTTANAYLACVRVII